MSRRDRIRMTDNEVAAFLEEPRTAAVATIGPDGRPHLVGMWFCLVDGDVAFWTYAKSQKARNLDRDPRVTVLVEDGESYDELRGVQIVGDAEIRTDPDEVLDVGIGVHRRHVGDEVTGDVVEGLRAIGAKRVAVVVRARQLASWDHRKLGGTY